MKKRRNRKKYPFIFIASVLVLIAILQASSQPADPTLLLANELALENDHNSAALEYRRLAMSDTVKQRRAGYYWVAAYHYELAGKYAVAQKMLDHTEDYSESLTTESLLLRARISLAENKLDEAAFYMDAIIAGEAPAPPKIFAARHLACYRLRTGNIASARQALKSTPDIKNKGNGLSALNQYQGGRNKTPAIGGLLGIVPGLGYAYSGEYANALRSFILNGIFIYAMLDTADDKEWGAFGALTFFELTWFTGSIYGGIDAAHRYNQSRMNTCLDAINADSDFYPDPIQIPIISLEFAF
ncbi:MAG: hypothetical protein KAH23_01485 [Kiritimatiellae bacterium]|nr:hypothetical protein [Kiritimatiellia bacterium]